MNTRSRIQRANRGTRVSRARGILSHEAQQTSLLHDIADAQSVQAKGMVPAEPDIPRLHIRRKKVYTFQRTYLVGGLNGSTTIDQFGALNFTLNNFPNASEFTSLFDQYRLLQVSVNFVPVSSAQALAPLYTVIDYDDSTLPTSLNDLLQYQSLQMTQSGQFHSRTLTPQFDMAAYSGAFTSYALSVPGQWVDVASPSVQWYGIKYCLPAFTTGATGIVFNIHASAVFQFRSER